MGKTTKPLGLMDTNASYYNSCTHNAVLDFFIFFFVLFLSYFVFLVFFSLFILTFFFLYFFVMYQDVNYLALKEKKVKYCPSVKQLGSG